MLDGIPHQISENLHRALVVLIDNGVQKLWVDALCIDQNNIDEKAAQVRRMATIFQEADNVITWLGPATSGSDQILNFLKTVDVSSLGDRFWARSFLRPYYCDGMTGAPRFSPEFLDFLDCEYWSRL